MIKNLENASHSRRPEVRDGAPTVRLRPYEISDVAALTEAVQESVHDMSRWMPWGHAAYGRSDAVAWIHASRKAHETASTHDFAVVDSQGCILGGCGINQINHAAGVANLGYWVRSSMTGRGVAPAAVRQLSEWVFGHTSLHRLEIVVAVSNPRSQRVAEKVGAHRDAVLRKRVLVDGLPEDAVLYSIVRPD